MRASLFSAAVLLVSAVHARAGFVISIQQVGSDVVASGSGTLNLADLTDGGSGASAFGANITVQPQTASVVLGPLAKHTLSDAYTGEITGPASFGSGDIYTPASSSTGPFFNFLLDIGGPTFIEVPDGYTSGTSLSASDTFDDNSLSGLGLTPGTYVYTWGTGDNADSLTIQIGPAATAPEPASLTLLSLGVAGLAGYGWRRRG